MNERLIRNFVVVADCLQLSSAASVVHLTQPALSRQISNLEEVWGVRLFERGARGLQLTSAGRDMRVAAEQILEAYEAARKLAASQSAQTPQSLKIAAPAVTLERFFPKVIARAKLVLPSLNIVLSDLSADPLRDLDSGKIDIAFLREGHYPVTFHRLYPVEYRAVGSSPVLAGDEESLQVSSILRQPLLIGPKGTWSRALIEEQAARERVALSIVYESHNQNALIELSAAGCGIAVVSSSSGQTLGPSCKKLLAEQEVVGGWFGLGISVTKEATIAASELISAAHAEVRASFGDATEPRANS